MALSVRRRRGLLPGFLAAAPCSPPGSGAMATPSEAAAGQQAGDMMSAAQAFKDNIAAKHGVKNKEQNALGQKEEGMTRYQMKKEAKRLMYLQSTEAAPEMRKITKKNASSRYYPGGMAFPGGEKTKKAFWGLSVRVSLSSLALALCAPPPAAFTNAAALYSRYVLALSVHLLLLGHSRVVRSASLTPRAAGVLSLCRRATAADTSLGRRARRC